MGTIKTILGVFLLVLLTGVLFLVWEGLSFLGSTAGSGEVQIAYEVSPGMTFKRAAKELEEKGIVTDHFKFYWLARLTGQSQKLRVGEYALTSAMKPREVLGVLTSGKSIEYPVTFQEGLNMYEMATLLEQMGRFRRDEFLKASKDQQLIRELLGESLPSFEGYLFPDTYLLTRFTTVKELITMMVKNFSQAWEQAQAQAIVKMRRHDAIILASVIEKETGAPEERRMISSVFHNRLAKSMRLQSDPTILYGILDLTQKMPTNIRRADILAPTKYNTYTVNGLPFGPIANPGREAMAAAVNPLTSEYLYFVSRNDGTHVFTKNYNDHLKAVRQYQLDKKAREGKSWRDLKTRK